MPKYESDIFSDTDISASNVSGLDIYMTSPKGKLNQYSPKSKTSLILLDNIPFDSHHPLNIDDKPLFFDSPIELDLFVGA